MRGERKGEMEEGRERETEGKIGRGEMEDRRGEERQKGRHRE